MLDEYSNYIQTIPIMLQQLIRNLEWLLIRQSHFKAKDITSDKGINL
jgi:hypothetical protein